MLNDRQELFCLEYIKDGNATQAAIRAGYSEKTANPTGARLLANVSIRARIDGLLDDLKSKKIAESTEVLETLTSILRRESLENVVITVKTRRSYYDENGKKVIEEKEEGKIVEIPTKNSDVNKAAELLAKRYGLLTENVKLSGNVPVQIIDDLGSDEDGG